METQTKMPVDNNLVWVKSPECDCKSPEDCTQTCSQHGKRKEVVIASGWSGKHMGTGKPDIEHETLLETLDDYYETIRHDPEKLKEFMVKFVTMNEERYHKSLEVFTRFGADIDSDIDIPTQFKTIPFDYARFNSIDERFIHHPNGEFERKEKL